MNQNRREFLQLAAAGAAMAAAPAIASSERQPPPMPPTDPGFRFAFLTDIHLQPELRAVDGFKQCLAEVGRLQPQPDFILTGGDMIMDALAQETGRAKELFRLYRQTLADNTNLGTYECIGNHDVFGWGDAKDHSIHDPRYGKQMYLEFFGLPRSYYRFDHRGWRFFVLDDIQPAGGHHYQAYIDEEQLAWFEDELKTKPPDMPAVVVSHIPICSVTGLEGNCDRAGHHIPVNMLCRDAYKLIMLMSRHNVRLALSGHMHQFDRIEFRGVTFICGGAVCGNWWKGPYKDIKEGFGVLDLAAGGGVAFSYRDYGWQATVK